MLVRICDPQSQQRTHQEFLVTKNTESARCGRRGIIFHLDVETILVSFAAEETAAKFCQTVKSIRCAFVKKRTTWSNVEQCVKV